jgi:hypothetical protein
MEYSRTSPKRKVYNYKCLCIIKKKRERDLGLGIVVHIYNSSYTDGGWRWGGSWFRASLGKKVNVTLF